MYTISRKEMGFDSRSAPPFDRRSCLTVKHKDFTCQAHVTDMTRGFLTNLKAKTFIHTIKRYSINNHGIALHKTRCIARESLFN